jgi:hypothetical protein
VGDAAGTGPLSKAERRLPRAAVVRRLRRAAAMREPHTLDAAQRSQANEQVRWLRSHGARSATEGPDVQS